jgi:hypothetical protein
MMVNFVCQLAQAKVPKYLVKHYFRCLNKGEFLFSDGVLDVNLDDSL